MEPAAAAPVTVGEDLPPTGDSTGLATGVAAVYVERAPGLAQPVKAKVRLTNDTFYDDYLHRGALEPGIAGMLVETPLRGMSYYTYAMFVKIVEGKGTRSSWTPINMLSQSTM